MENLYHTNLIKKVINLSNANNWEAAVTEWNIVDFEEDQYKHSSCICGKENLRYLYTIKNIKTNNILYPIGSSCIKKFNRADLNEKTSITEKLFKLYHAIEDSSYIEFNSNNFSRNVLEYLFKQGAFKPSKFNNFNGEIDYKFMVKMFNKRNPQSPKEMKKINAIIVNSIKPYLKDQLEKKINK